MLDSCMGSSTTGIACYLTNRNYIGMELEDNYYTTSLGRMISEAKGAERVSANEIISR